MIPTNEEIYLKAQREASNIMSNKDIAMNAMFDLRKLLTIEHKKKLSKRVKSIT